jgi:uncharacterized membrane protein
MTFLILGLILFVGGHSLSLARGLRGAALVRFGEGGFKALYTLVALAGFALIVKGYGDYRAAGYIQVWSSPVWTRHLSALLMVPVLPLLFSAYAQGYVKARLKHPMILAVKVWSLGHLLANGDLGSILLFGSFLLWAILGFRSMRRRPVDPQKNFVPNPGQDAAAILGGLIAYGLLVGGLHRWLIGVGVFG